MTIVDDAVLEGTEMFIVSLTRTADLDQRISLGPVDGTVQINDNDGRNHLPSYMRGVSPSKT